MKTNEPLQANFNTVKAVGKRNEHGILCVSIIPTDAKATKMSEVVYPIPPDMEEAYTDGITGEFHFADMVLRELL